MKKILTKASVWALLTGIVCCPISVYAEENTDVNMDVIESTEELLKEEFIEISTAEDLINIKENLIMK